jgi:hypothetical protein
MCNAQAAISLVSPRKNRFTALLACYLYASIPTESVMKFGIFYEHQIPRPWTELSEYEHFQNALKQVELADQCGYDFAWQVEHHFLEEYSHGSSPRANGLRIFASDTVYFS